MDKEDIIFGVRAVAEALNAGTDINRVLIRQDFSGEGLTQLIKTMRQQGVPYQHVPRERFNTWRESAHQGVVAFVSPVNFTTCSDLLPQLLEEGKTPLLLVLDGVTDIRNLGAIARSAECFGIHAVVFSGKGGAAINADAIKSSAGALLKLPLCRERSLVATLRDLKNDGIKLIACTEKTDKRVNELDFSEPMAVIMGAEGEGISPAVMRETTESARIEMSGSIGSLNVSVAAGIICYEAHEQRRLLGIN